MVPRLILLMLCAATPPAHAQPWVDAFHIGDYEKAADLLHPGVAEADVLTFSDP